jgi:predicted Zn-dependent protease
MSRQQPLDLAGHVLELVRDRAGAAVEAEVGVNRQALALTRFANSFIHQNVAHDATTVRLTVHSHGRTASASTTVTSAGGLADLVARTLDAVRLAPADPTWPGLAPPAPVHGAPDCDDATVAASPDERAARVRAFVDAAGLDTAGYCRTLHWVTAFVNSAGQSATSETSEAAMDAIARANGSDGVARLVSPRLRDIDGAVLGARAGAKARAAVEAVELPPGRYEVVLEPSAVADLLANFAIWGFNAKPYVERRSFVELGAAQFDPSITFADDPLRPGGPGSAVDGQGTPKRRLVLVNAGVTSAVTHNRQTAKLAGGEAVSTGHRVPEGGSHFGAVALNLGLAPGAGGAESGGGASVVHPAAAGLVPAVERGLLVTDLWYTRILDPKTLVMTGLTRNGVWLIEDGKVTTPVQNLRFTQSYPRALGPGAVKGVGPEAVLQPGSWGIAWWSAPALHLASWNFTGGASG